jgi:glycosyltransferase involved in cell wall biosynthesis
MLLSIITINYNNKIGLERTIKSVQEQTFTNFEHIIIDGGSNDGSKELIEANKFSLSYWVSEPDKGIYNAMNRGIRVAKGDYLFFLNSSDKLNDKNAIRNAVVHLINEDIVYFDIKVVAIGESYIKECPNKLSFNYLYNDLPPHQSTFLHKSLFEKYGYYDESLKIVADWKFLIIVLLKYNATYKHVNETFSTFYEGGISSKEGSFEAMKKERELVLKSEFPILMNDVEENFRLNRVIRNLRKSKKINLLVRLGLIEKF